MWPRPSRSVGSGRAASRSRLRRLRAEPRDGRHAAGSRDDRQRRCVLRLPDQPHRHRAAIRRHPARRDEQHCRRHRLCRALPRRVTHDARESRAAALVSVSGFLPRRCGPRRLSICRQVLIRIRMRNVYSVRRPVELLQSVSNGFGFIVSLCLFQQTQVEWRRVFLIAAAVYLVGAVVFAVFASGELQPWGVPKGALDIQSMDTSQTAGGKRREHDDTDEQTTMLRDDETASHKDVLS